MQRIRRPAARPKVSALWLHAGSVDSRFAFKVTTIFSAVVIAPPGSIYADLLDKPLALENKDSDFKVTVNVGR